MNEEIVRWQEDARRAFDWISHLYEQAQGVWEDAQAYFEEEKWTVQCGEGFGGIAMSMSDLRNWPFAYFKVMGATPSGPEDHDSGKGVFFGFAFYDSTRSHGPTCVAGVVTWSSPDARCDHWALYAAVNGDVPAGFDGTFTVEDGPIHHARATDKGRKVRPGVEEVQWFEVPLGSITSADRLHDILRATVDLFKGDAASAMALVQAT